MSTKTAENPVEDTEFVSDLSYCHVSIWIGILAKEELMSSSFQTPRDGRGAMMESVSASTPNSIPLAETFIRSSPETESTHLPYFYSICTRMQFRRDNWYIAVIIRV